MMEFEKVKRVNELVDDINSTYASIAAIQRNITVDVYKVSLLLSKVGTPREAYECLNLLNLIGVSDVCNYLVEGLSRKRDKMIKELGTYKVKDLPKFLKVVITEVE